MALGDLTHTWCQVDGWARQFLRFLPTFDSIILFCPVFFFSDVSCGHFGHPVQTGTGDGKCEL